MVVLGDNDDDGSRLQPGISRVLVGEDGQGLSAQIVREVFTVLTEKNESLDEFFRKPYQINFSDIEQLHRKVEQTMVQYHVISKGLRFIIYYINDTKNEISSFEEMLRLSASSSSQVESVYLKYSFIVNPPSGKKVESYSVSVRIMSTIALQNRLNSVSFLGSSPNILRIMGGCTAISKIEYMDYTVARAFQTTINEWFSELNHADELVAIRFLQRYSHNIPKILSLMTVLAACLFIYQGVVDGEFIKGNDSAHFARFSIVAFALIFASHSLSNWFARYIEGSIDGWAPISYVHLNKRDESEIKKFERTNKKSILKAVAGLVATLCISIVTKVVVTLITAKIIGL